MIRKKFEPAFKARVALEALKGDKILAELSSQYGVHSNMITRWKPPPDPWNISADGADESEVYSTGIAVG